MTRSRVSATNVVPYRAATTRAVRSAPNAQNARDQIEAERREERRSAPMGLFGIIFWTFLGRIDLAFEYFDMDVLFEED